MAISFDAVHLQIHIPGDGVLRDRAWLQESIAEPEAFAASLFRHAAQLAPSPCKSQHGIGYDFYHDLVLRHATGPAAARPALLWPEGGGKGTLRTLSYAHLHLASTLLAVAWRKRGVLAGHKICIVYPLGPEFLITVCTALRLGLVVSVLPPLGVDFLCHRLDALAPDFVVTARRYQTLLRTWYAERAPALAEWLLEEPRIGAYTSAGPAGAVPLITPEPSELGAESAVYAPDKAALALFSPLREPTYTPIAVPALSLYVGLLRDGFLLGIDHLGSVVAAPDHHLLQYQPTLVLMTLIHGGTYLHLSATEFAGEGVEPARLPPITALLLSAAVRDAILLRPARALREVQFWVCPVGEASEPVKWHDLVARGQLDAVPSACWLYDAACTGALVFSLRQRGVPPQIVYPVPGRRFALDDPAVEGMPTRVGHGILRPLPGSVGVLLVEYAGGHVYGGTQQPTRRGRTMSQHELETVVGSLPFVAGAVLVPEPSDRGTATLLVFIGPHMKTASEIKLRAMHSAVEEHITTHLGSEFVPSDINLVAALPRRTESGIDHGWCADQQRSGELARRAADPVFHLLDKLQFACHWASTPIGQLQLLAKRTRK